MRTLENFEIQFWNCTSISVLIDCGFILEINNGLITGMEMEGENNKNGNKNES